jgi:biotin carboxyl carrier protein
VAQPRPGKADRQDGVIVEVRVTENEPVGEGEVIALIELA